MATFSIICPLCCNETFNTHAALKYHLLSFVDNISCPACNARCDNILDLTEHLGRECKDISTVVPPPKKIKLEPTDTELEQIFLTKTDHENVDVGPHTHQFAEVSKVQSEDQAGERQNLMYTCQMCNISFDSIEDHLAKYHEGEEVVLETENEEAQVNTDDGNEDSSAYDEYLNENDGDDDNTGSQTTHPTVDEEQCFDKKGRVYTRKMVKIDKFWMNDQENSGPKKPLTEKYLMENGKIKRITDIEAEGVEDKSQIIEIHQCSRCALQFPNINHFNNHKCDVKVSQKSPGKVRYKCSDCSAAYPTLAALNDHMKSHIETDSSGKIKKTITMGPQVCEICNTMFPSFKSLRLHKRMHEPVKTKEIEAPVQYSIMGPKDDNEGETAVRHMFTCAVCNKTYDIAYEEIHMKSHSEQEDCVCSVCNRKFYTKENLEMHMKAHSNVKKFTCSYCKKPFNTFNALEEHVTNQCTRRQYECQFCGRRFSRPHEKVKHERIHTGEKPHICQICGKAFRVSYCLTLHMRTHSGTRPYHCEHCGKRFKSHSVYNHHLQTHSDIRNYQCPYCPKAFKTAVQLAGHKNSHTKPFSCTECNRPFASLYAVRAHMETHKRENNLKFDCWLCGATYARAFALKDHMKSVHSDYDMAAADTDESLLLTLEDETSSTHIENGMSQESVDNDMEHQTEDIEENNYVEEEEEEEKNAEEYEQMQTDEVEQKAKVEPLET